MCSLLVTVLILKVLSDKGWTRKSMMPGWTDFMILTIRIVLFYLRILCGAVIQVVLLRLLHFLWLFMKSNQLCFTLNSHNISFVTFRVFIGSINLIQIIWASKIITSWPFDLSRLWKLIDFFISHFQY